MGQEVSEKAAAAEPGGHGWSGSTRTSCQKHTEAPYTRSLWLRLADSRISTTARGAAFNDAAQEDNEENVDKLSANKQFSHKGRGQSKLGCAFPQMRQHIQRGNLGQHSPGQRAGCWDAAGEHLRINLTKTLRGPDVKMWGYFTKFYHFPADLWAFFR